MGPREVPLTLRQYIDAYREREGTNLTEALQAFAAKSEVSFTTIKGVYYGQKLQKYPMAQRCETASGGAVTIKELCE